jgi:prepilin-type N-terminal cleavage/methylation domain-containing protein
MKPQLDARGFTFLEVLVSIAIIGTLASIAIPLYASYTERARSAACLLEREKINKIIVIHYNENPEKPLDSLARIVEEGYLDSSPQCPHGGEYVLVPAGENQVFPKVACSLHHFPEIPETPGSGEDEQPLEPHLAGSWSMEEGTGYAIGTVAPQGTIQGAEWVAGKVGTALQFSGVNNGLDDYVKIPDHQSLNLTDQGSLQGWINPSSIRPYAGIIHKGNRKDFSDEAYSLQFYGRKLALGIVDESGAFWRLQSNVTPSIGAWTHVAATWDSSGMTLYVNGQAVPATLYRSLDGTRWTRAEDRKEAVAARVTTGDMQIGAQLDQSYNGDLRNLGFSGVIDEVKIYNMAKSAEAILAYYNGIK